MGVNLKQRIGLRVKAVRQDRKMSQEDLAYECGLSKASISNIERGIFILPLRP